MILAIRLLLLGQIYYLNLMIVGCWLFFMTLAYDGGCWALFLTMIYDGDG